MPISTNPQKINICAIVVSHSPGNDFLSNIKAAADQVGKVVVINNGSQKISKNIFEAAGLDNIHLISNAKNYGQGKALNQGAEWAVSNGYEWILLLDQDSKSDLKMVENEILAYEKCPFKESIGLIGVNCSYENTGEIKYNSNDPKGIFFERNVIMTSGMLLSLEAYKKTGPLREEFFIDSTDADYCLRLRKNGFKIIVALKAMMEQRVGEGAFMKKFFWKKILVTNHSPERCYYMTRNGLILVREYLFLEPQWCLRRIVWYFCVKPMFVIFYEKEKIRKIKFILNGILHAFIKNNFELDE